MNMRQSKLNRECYKRCDDAVVRIELAYSNIFLKYASIIIYWNGLEFELGDCAIKPTVS